MMRVRKRPGVRLVTAAVEDELHLVGTPKIQILTDDIFKQDAAAERSVQDLSQGELGLQNGDVIAIAGGTVFRREWMGQERQPLAQQIIDLGWAKSITDGL